MKRYDHLILKMDFDSIALLFADNGDLGNMAHGRDSIRKFLLKFKDFKVISQSSITRSIDMAGDSSIQQGFYYQTVVVPKSDTIKVKGAYTADWIWNPAQGWQIKRMETKPLK